MEQKPVGMLGMCTYIFSKRQRLCLLGVGLLLFAAAIMETGVTALMLPFMNTITAPESIGQSAYRRVIYQLFRCQNSADFLVAMAVLLAVAYLVKGFFLLVSTMVQQTFLSKTQANLSARLFDCYLKKSYAYHLHKNSAEIQKSVTTDISMLTQAMQTTLSLLSESLTAICMLIMLFTVDPLLTLVAAVLIGVCLVGINLVISRRLKRISKNYYAANVQMYKSAAQAMGGLKSIKVTHADQLFVNDYSQSAARFANLYKKHMIISVIPRTAVESVSMAGIFLFMALLVRRGTALDAMLPLFATFALAAVRLMPCATRIVAAYNGMLFNSTAVRAIYDALLESDTNMQVEKDVTGPVPPLVPTQPLRTGVELRHLSFRYSDAQNDLFTDVNLTLPAQKSTAFVGVTGSGKTTLADLILGLHTPTGGSIYADGHDIFAEADWWAQRVGYIPQNIYLCDDTIAANVAFGRGVENTDLDRVWYCLEQAQMRAFVEGLPDGIGTVVGEQGIRLSGGQRQRIGIARALYTDPQLLVMDEATSALDTDTEQAIIDSINKLAGHKTLLIIAHRLTTIKDCDLIYRVENGAVTRER